ncbi:hypothetical protein LQF12_06040 [Ruania suaedae]|uniref:hypothetical protein n=1 Tax=Ruania suaedae TaxID=2897774 RepID=UPI001E3714AE|nr:hypothetical protein [Ruania suaedae]UFU04145.1 hypothetical protein LQF12_06040 [Ruania suaedae]
MTETQARRAPQWLRVAGHMSRGLVPNTLWFWGLCLVLGAAAIWILQRFADGPPFSIMSLLRYGLIWYPFSAALILITLMLGIHVAAGQTRRSFLIASLLSWAGYAIVNGLVLAVVTAIERQVYDDFGWAHRSTSEGDLPALVPSLGIYPLIVIAGAVSGMLVGLAYYRFGPWITLALPLTSAPAVMATALATSPVPLAGIAVATVLAAVAVVLLGRRAPIRTTTAWA